MVTIARLLAVLKYDPETGLFTWNENRRRNVKKRGDVAGKPRKRGYSQIWIDNRPYNSHRLAFACMTGEWPRGPIDHIDGDISNNRWTNLRECPSGTFNNANMRKSARNTSGIKGVSWSGRTSKWYASIQVRGKTLNLGYYKNISDAARAYSEAASKHFGEFARVA